MKHYNVKVCIWCNLEISKVWFSTKPTYYCQYCQTIDGPIKTLQVSEEQL